MATKPAKILHHQVHGTKWPARGSRHHQYSLVKVKPYSQWRKAVTHAVALDRLDPSSLDGRLEVLLQSAEEDFNFDTGKLRFNYDNDVLCLYSEPEHEYFISMHSSLVERGLLVPYEASDSAVAMPNVLQAEDITGWADSPYSTFAERVNECSEPAVLQRLRSVLTPDHSQRKHDCLNNRLSMLLDQALPTYQSQVLTDNPKIKPYGTERE